MADSVVEKKETTVATPEKEVEKPTPELDDEDSKTSENGDAKLKENGEKPANGEEAKDSENGDSTDAPAEDACPVKRKSAGGDAPDGTPAEGASPEKKAKLEEKAAAETESNGEEAKAAA